MSSLESEETITEPDTSSQQTEHSPQLDNLLDSVLGNLFNSNLMQKISSLHENQTSNQDSSQSNQSTEVPQDSDDEDIDLDLYLLDERGNNICDHLENINNTLVHLQETFETFSKHYIQNSK